MNGTASAARDGASRGQSAFLAKLVEARDCTVPGSEELARLATELKGVN